MQGNQRTRATREREGENREQREVWRTGEPTPGGSQSINSLTRSPTERDLLLSLRSRCGYIYGQPGSLHYVRPLGCLQPFCNRSPCTVSLESPCPHPPSRSVESGNRSTMTRERSSARSKGSIELAQASRDIGFSSAAPFCFFFFLCCVQKIFSTFGGLAASDGLAGCIGG